MQAIRAQPNRATANNNQCPRTYQGRNNGRQADHNNPNQIPVAACKTCNRNHAGKPCHVETGACFNCGQQGHVAKYCPRKAIEANPAPAPTTNGRVFTMTTRVVAHAQGTIIGFLKILGIKVTTLFDTGAKHSVIALSFAHRVNLCASALSPTISIATPLGNSVIIDCIYRDCPIVIEEKILPAQLLLMELHDFDIILGMDWLSSHRAHVDCFEKQIFFGDAVRPDFVYQGTSPSGLVKIVSALKAHKLIRSGCEGYLAAI